MCCDTKETFHQIYNPVLFRLSRIKEIEDSGKAEINDGEKMSKTLNKYIVALNYAEKAVLVFPGASSSICLCCFATAIGTLVDIAIAIVGLVFFIINGIIKMFLKTTGKKKTNKHRKIALLARCKLSSIKKIISKALIDSNIIHEEFTLMINKGQNCFRLKESFKTK